MIQLPKHQIDGTNSGSRLKVGLTFGTLRKASWLVAKGLVIAEGPRTSRNLTGNALPVEVPSPAQDTAEESESVIGTNYPR